MKYVKYQCKTSLKQHLARVTVLASKIIPEQSWEQSHNWAELRTTSRLCRSGDNLTRGRTSDNSIVEESWGQHHS